ncbi:hypothetical protein M407DRAFT_22181 [Tulasnella calospora MUT 4182]|uniref:Peptidase S28 n=1 Tax=Tulasnella calospora MUT 4182 TaxID=1051891 RepID=A0A0C3M4I7_9AGAM|nr:hypothetical protein M407DRAFT_22181 [Tulasnella calospora MUT 4182]
MSFGAAGVVLEHRYWGKSSPFEPLGTAELEYLTLDQAIEDVRYFVDEVKLPWTKKATSSHPDMAPWINMGCSYSGILSAYTQKKYPNKFAAAWASSAPVQAQGDFWQYFEPIEEGMPKNCSKDLAAVIRAVDHTLLHGRATEKQKLKESFGLYNLRDDDFAQALVYPLYSWQSMQASSYATSGEDRFFRMCDAIETHSDGTVERTAKGVGLPTALNNLAKYIQTEIAPCDYGEPGGSCWSTYDYSTDFYKNWFVYNGSNRQWYWLVCNEFGWFGEGDPGNYSSIVSSLVTVNYKLREVGQSWLVPSTLRRTKGNHSQCNHLFPNADGSPGNFHPNTRGTNSKHGGGWNIRANNLFVVNGEFDPWRSASLSSRWAPKFRNTQHQLVEVIKGGHHCWDFNLDGAKYNPDIKRVVDKGVKTVQGWLKQWYKAHPRVKNSIPKGKIDFWAGLL